MLQRRSASKPRADQQPRPRLNRFPPVHRVIRLHRPDHLVDAAPLECVHRRGLVPVDMTRLRGLLGAVEYAPVFEPVMRLQEFDERLPVVGQQKERLREPGGGCLAAGNGYTWSGRPYAGPS